VAVGDFDGDGQRDVIVGEPRVDSPFIGPGRATIFLGPIPSGSFRPGQIRSQVLLGEQEKDLFGFVVAAANSLGGPEDDAIIGSPGFGRNPLISPLWGTGRVQIFPGIPGGISGSAAQTINGPSFPPDNAFGRGFAVGDVNGNGLADIAIGNMAPGIGFSWEHEARVADLNGDPCAEVAVGVPTADSGGGRVHVLENRVSQPGVLERQAIPSPSGVGFGSFVTIGNVFDSLPRELVAASTNQVFIFGLIQASTLSPSNATAGGPDFGLTVNGSNFLAGSTVQWNGANRTTTVTNELFPKSHHFWANRWRDE
jgi:hypothetical protein